MKRKTPDIQPAVVPESHKAIRQAIRDFALKDAEPWFKEQLVRLYDAWEKWNEQFFNSEMVVPCIFLTEPNTPRALADCANISAFGARSQIRIRPSLLTGKHPNINPDAPLEGRVRFIADVMLHEMIHQLQNEVLNNPELSYKGHGPAFAGKCNEIGAVLGLDKVRVAKARGKDKDMPSCAYWPHNVRPLDYFLGAYVPTVEVKKEKADGDGENEDDDGLDEGIDAVDDLVSRFQRLKDKQRMLFLDRLKAVMSK